MCRKFPQAQARAGKASRLAGKFVATALVQPCAGSSAAGPTARLSDAAAAYDAGAVWGRHTIAAALAFRLCAVTPGPVIEQCIRDKERSAQCQMQICNQEWRKSSWRHCNARTAGIALQSLPPPCGRSREKTLVLVGADHLDQPEEVPLKNG
jgi:hypothetical protein